MEFSEVLRLGGHSWDSYNSSFDPEVRLNDWVLLVRSPAPLQHRVLAVFDERFLEIGESIDDAVSNWEEEANDKFEYLLVEDFETLLAEEYEEYEDPDDDEDSIAQYWEDEAWRDDL